MQYGFYKSTPNEDGDDDGEAHHRRKLQELHDWRLRKMLDLIPVGLLSMTQVQEYIDLSQYPYQDVEEALRLLRRGVDAREVLRLVM